MNHRRMQRAPLARVMAICAALLSTSAFVGCSGQRGSGQQDNGAPVEVLVLGLSAGDVTTVTITITGGPGGLPTSTVNLAKGANGAWTGAVTGMPAGTGYTFSMAAKNSTGTTLYSGTASSVAVTANQVAEVVITGQQAAAPPVFGNAPPVIDSILVSSINVVPGGMVALAASAHDPNNDPLTYVWTANGGLFSAPSSNLTNWTAPPAPGSYVLTLTVSDPSLATVSAQIGVTVVADGGTGSANITATLNTWPVVTNVTGTPNYLVKGAKTLLTALASDADNDPISYAWTCTCTTGPCDASWFDNGQIATPGFTLPSTATDTSCMFSVVVADNRGGSTTATLTLPVGQPTTAVAPTIGETVQSGQLVGPTDTVTLIVNATDPKSLPLTFTWLPSGGNLGNPNTTANTSQVAWTPPTGTPPASWLVTATVGNGTGATATKTFTIKPSSCFGGTPAASSPWSFGVMADTQWISTDDGKNPNSVAVDIINKLNAEFIAKQVKFVVAVGDITDNGSNLALDTRAKFVQALYNAQIGFFPLRGNHEPTAVAAAEFIRIFPQTLTGSNNNSPANVVFPTLTDLDDLNTNPVAVIGLPFALGSNFSKPSSVLGATVTAWDGLSYSFDYGNAYGNARFVLLDQFMMANGTSASGNYQIAPQLPWIQAVLSSKPATSHAFVFGHKGIITENHVDTLFGSDPSKDPASQDTFITSLHTNGVRYYMGGHDHMHNRAIVTTTDGTTASVQDIICASDSSKFYIPANPSTDVHYDLPLPTTTPPGFGHTRETPIAQELSTVGYYIVTIDGVKATVDFYSAEVNPTLVSGENLIYTTPQLNFTKRETYGYGLNGKQFVVPQAQSYTVVTDSSPSASTTASILSGTNANTNVEGGGRNPVKTVDTGWTAGDCSTSSDILSLWMTVSTLGSDQTDTYVLSMNYNQAIPAGVAGLGNFGIATKDASGTWVNAVSKNHGGGGSFHKSGWASGAGYGLGDWGVDTGSHTAWAIINHSSDFAVAAF